MVIMDDLYENLIYRTVILTLNDLDVLLSYSWNLSKSNLLKNIAIVPYGVGHPHRRRTTVSVLAYTICSYQIMLVISLTITLLCECYLETSTY